MYASNEGDEPTAGSARERVLSTAARLFYAHGVRATGIDRIIAEAGVAKMSFYRHFPSKSGLVQAFLDRRHAQWMAWFEAALQRRVAQAGVPRLSMLADVLGEWFAQADFRGCAFINLVAEDGEADGPERALAFAHKLELQAFVAGFARSAGVPDPDRAAALAMVVIEGAIVRTHMTGDAAMAGLAARLLDGIAIGLRDGRAS